MKLNKDFILKDMKGADGEITYYAIAVGKTAKNFKGMVKLNDSAAFMWNSIKQGADSEAKIAEALTKEYAISDVQAKIDVAEVIKGLREIGAIID